MNKTSSIPNSTSSPTGSFGSSSASLEFTTTATEQEHSNSSGDNFHQQLLDGLESLSVTDSKVKATGNSVAPLLTPANSVCAGDDFALFSSEPFTNDIVISTNGKESSGGKKKTDEDLWSDFESFRNENTGSSNAMPTGTNNSAAAKFDDWAKF